LNHLLWASREIESKSSQAHKDGGDIRQADTPKTTLYSDNFRERHLYVKEWGEYSMKHGLDDAPEDEIEMQRTKFDVYFRGKVVSIVGQGLMGGKVGPGIDEDDYEDEEALESDEDVAMESEDVVSKWAFDVKVKEEWI
jgi:hypothetical protein